ncbi:MAG: hypothetical protein AAF493_04825 [Pseudomonadota bacterium]
MRIFCVLAIAAGLTGAISPADAVDVYRYHGLKAATSEAARDGVYQDFTLDADNLGKLWTDPDGQLHGSNDSGWIRARVVRNESEPFLRLEFAREGYGVNAGVSPRERVPELIPANGMLLFEARSSTGACTGIRMMDRDGEIWGFGAKGLKYQRICLPEGSEWVRFVVPLKDRPQWFQFPHSGNAELGNNEMEADMVAMLSFELGTHNETHLGRGVGTLDIRNIRVTSH